VFPFVDPLPLLFALLPGLVGESQQHGVVSSRDLITGVGEHVVGS